MRSVLRRAGIRPYSVVMSSIILASAVAPSSWLYSIGQPLAGGVLLGMGALLLLSTVGRLAGVSGILGGLLPPPRADRDVEVGFRVAFLVGLVTVGFVAHLVNPASIANDAPRSLLTLVLAGLAVGFGTRLGNGCTSGHGVCGVSRFAPRSIVATCTFIGTAALTFFVVKSLGGEQ